MKEILEILKMPAFRTLKRNQRWSVIFVAISVLGLVLLLKNSKSIGDDSVTIGEVSRAVGNRSVVIGPSDRSGSISLTNSIAIGYNASAGAGSIAIGANARAGSVTHNYDYGGSNIAKQIMEKLDSMDTNRVLVIYYSNQLMSLRAIQNSNFQEKLSLESMLSNSVVRILDLESQVTNMVAIDKLPRDEQARIRNAVSTARAQPFGGTFLRGKVTISGRATVR